MFITGVFAYLLYLSVALGWQHTNVSYYIEDSSLALPVSDTLDVWYQPIRIHVHEVDLAQHLSDPAVYTLYMELIDEAVQTVQQLLRVFPVSGSLKLAYDTVQLCKIQLETNRLLCAEKWRNAVPREDCGLEEGFKIPEDHLADFRVYSNETTSVIDIAGGAGVDNTDIILYASAKTLAYCRNQNSGVLGFARICKRDQFGRPIASFINICPAGFGSISRGKLRETIFHEILHAMGFIGSSLVMLIKSCKITNRQLDCEFLRDFIYVYDFPRAVLADKAVVTRNDRYEFVGKNTKSAWQEHINCRSLPNDGPVWSLYKDPDSERIESTPGDHWTWTSMMGSKMSRFVKEPYMQVLDNMTIAWFKDTGWYKVSDNFTEPYLWGKNSGCGFGHPTNSCKQVVDGNAHSRFLCKTRGESGCHYLHLHKGTCASTESTLPMCHYYKPDAEGECFISRPKDTNSLEEYCEDCRCFVSSLHMSDSSPTQGSCYRRRCVEERLEVHINGLWVSCPYNQTIEVEGVAGTVHCPPSDVLCTSRDLKLSTMIESPATTITTSTTTSTTTTTADPFNSVVIEETTSPAISCHSCRLVASAVVYVMLTFIFLPVY